MKTKDHKTLIAKWKKILHLEDWEIHFEVCELPEDTRAQMTQKDAAQKKAFLQFNGVILEESIPRTIEEDVIHELLHVLEPTEVDIIKGSAKIKKILSEIWIDRIERILYERLR